VRKSAKKRDKKKPFYDLVKAVKEIGWNVAVPKAGKKVVGLVIGQEEYVDSILAALDKAKWKWKGKGK
jgi:hypothetical protein